LYLGARIIPSENDVEAFIRELLTASHGTHLRRITSEEALAADIGSILSNLAAIHGDGVAILKKRKTIC